MLKNLLEISSELRFSVNEAMSHNWFQNSKMQFSSNSKSSPLNKTACFEKNFFRFQKPYFDESYSIIKKKPVFKISESLVSRKNSCKNKDKDDEKNICELLSFKNKYYFNKQSSSSLKSFLEKNAIRTNELKNKSMKIEEVKNQNELEKIFGIHNLDI